MATGKKNILVYADWIDKFEELTDDEAGKLIKHFFRYVNDLNPEYPDRTTKLMFMDIKATLKRDLGKWEDSSPQRIEKARLAGLASAEARRLKKQLDLTNEFDLVEFPTQSTVSVNDNVNDNVNDIVILKAIPLPLDNDFDLFWKKYNKKVDSKKCKDKFKKLSKIQVETILKVVDSYVAATSDVQYRKNPLTWLNGECWKDVEVNTFLPTKDKPFGKSNQL